MEINGNFICLFVIDKLEIKLFRMNWRFLHKRFHFWWIDEYLFFNPSFPIKYYLSKCWEVLITSPHLICSVEVRGCWLEARGWRMASLCEMEENAALDRWPGDLVISVQYSWGRISHQPFKRYAVTLEHANDFWINIMNTYSYKTKCFPFSTK